jgi:peptide/nickel transport system substrate-binding protein
VTTKDAGKVVRIDPTTDRVARTTVPGAPTAVAAVGDRVFVASATSYLGHRGGRLRVTLAKTPPGPGYPIIDPAFGGDLVGSVVQAATGDTLVTQARAPGPASNSLVPDLVDALPQPLPTTTQYSFRLRPDIRFSTGQILRASDVRATFQRVILMDPGLAGSPLGSIVGVRACVTQKALKARQCDLSTGIKTNDAERTVRFVLTRPETKFLSSLAAISVTIVPTGEPVFTFEDFAKQHPVIPGTGPYRVSRFIWPHSLELVRNKYFHQWSRAAHPDGYADVIDVNVSAPSEKNLTDLEQGRIDVLQDFELSTADEQRVVGGNHDVVKRDELGSTVREAVLNTRRPPFDNPDARRAVNFAMDRQAFIAEQQRQSAESMTVTCQVLVPGMTGYRRNCPYTVQPNAAGAWTGPDLARARELVRESGTQGARVRVSAPPLDYEGEPSAAMLAQVLNRIGYRASVGRPYKSFAGYATAIFSGRDQAGVMGIGAATDSGDQVGGFTCNAGDPSMYCDAAFDAAYHKALAASASDPQRASDTWTALDRYLVSHAASAPLWVETGYALTSTKVGNFSSNAIAGMLVDQFWVR